jgi:4-hydroxymandelate oxidase
LTSTRVRPPANSELSSSLGDLVCLHDFEGCAKGLVSSIAWEYIHSGAADEITLRANRERLDGIRLCPRVLRDAGLLDTRTSVLGMELPFPLMIAPTALHKLVHAEGELATVRGANAAGVPFTLSTLSSVSIEDVAAQATVPLWFQLYIQRDRELTRSLVQRAEAAKFAGLCVTVDTPILGVRNRLQRARFVVPPEIEFANLHEIEVKRERHGGTGAFTGVVPESMTWKDIEWLQSFSKIPIVLKGILNPEDADQAAQLGVAGIIVSNHGARDLDTLPATIDALPRVADRIAGRISVLMDGGIRRGTDILKALALGAAAVLVGRPVLYGLGAGGEHGVERILKILRSELELTMALSGRPTIADIDPTLIWS